MSKVFLIIGSLLWVSLSFASGGGGGGGGGGGAGGASSRAKEASPTKVYEAREKMRERMQAKSNEKRKGAVTGFDHSYVSTSAILKKSVSWHSNRQKTTVDYKAFTSAEINAVANELLSPNKNQVMKTFSKNERLAYFINLYNVLTLKLIKDNYATVKKKKEKGSINDIKTGGFFRKPWDMKFFKLFGVERTLNNIEHGYIRGDLNDREYKQSKREYNDPRIHFAVNCASKGCPALLDKAFTAKNLKSEMQTAMVNFLKDKKRNFFKGSTLKLSPIISKWYDDDFSRGLLGYTSVEDFAAKNAQYLTNDPKKLKLLKSKKVKIKSSTYDWTLNDAI